jgi:hypothetical protein
MSVRFEGAQAKDLHVAFANRGEALGEDVVTDMAVVLSYDEVFYIEGSVTELLDLAQRFLAVIVQAVEEDNQRFQRESRT